MSTRPLTLEQQNWLRVNAYLPVMMILMLIGVLGGIFLCLFINFAESTFVRIFAGLSGLIVALVLIATGIHSYNNFMDMRDGVTQVRVGRLIGKRETGRAPKTFYAEFENAGSIIIMGDVYEKLEQGQTYKVTFSPRTRRGWDVELQS